MSDVAALVQAVLAAPDDDSPRLVLADALLQQGDPLGEFILLQCQLATMREDLESDDWNGRKLRERELIAQHRAKWLPYDPAPASMIRFTFRRGFVEHVSGPLHALVAVAGELLARYPLLRAYAPHREGLSEWKIQFPAFLVSPLAARIEELSLGPWTDDSDIEAMALPASLARLKTLSIEAPLEPIGGQALAAGPWRLEHLSLSGTRIGTRGLQAVLTFPLRTLTVHGERLGAEGASVIGYQGGALETLLLGEGWVGDEGAGMLARAKPLGGLKELRLESCKIGAAGAAALGSSTELAAVASLDLRGNRLGKGGVGKLLDGGGLPALRELNLRDTALKDAGAAVVAASAKTATLERLNLRDNGLTDACVPALSKLTGLKLLNVNQNRLSIAAQQALRAALPGTIVYAATQQR